MSNCGPSAGKATELIEERNFFFYHENITKNKILLLNVNII